PAIRRGLFVTPWSSFFYLLLLILILIPIPQKGELDYNKDSDWENQIPADILILAERLAGRFRFSSCRPTGWILFAAGRKAMISGSSGCKGMKPGRVLLWTIIFVALVVGA